MLKRSAASFGTACFALLGAACDSGSSGKLDEYYERALADVQVNGTVQNSAVQNSATQNSAETEPAGEQRALPAGFTVYPDAIVVTDDPIETDSGSGQVISMTTRASPAEVAQFYRRQAERAGLPVERTTDAQGTVTLAGSKPDGASIDLTAAQMGDGGTSANLMVLGDS